MLLAFGSSKYNPCTVVAPCCQNDRSVDCLFAVSFCFVAMVDTMPPDVFHDVDADHNVHAVRSLPVPATPAVPWVVMGHRGPGDRSHYTIVCATTKLSRETSKSICPNARTFF